jgi:hypothetical protein
MASFARFWFKIWRLKSKNLIYLQLKFVKLFCKYNVILAEHTVASHTSSDITGEFCDFTKNHTNIFLKILHTKQNKSTVIETFHRKIDIDRCFSTTEA